MRGTTYPIRIVCLLFEVKNGVVFFFVLVPIPVALLFLLLSKVCGNPKDSYLTMVQGVVLAFVSFFLLVVVRGYRVLPPFLTLEGSIS